uniref:Retrovirus-related Pol polyprotein from transposon TNT 1-94-like beta-barrel domain-containing protein n=1 Tax=Nicotiana tabacum TaxID=4097 RepID=A0A1S4C970_TOBAC|nr:PREDICTED: uncharacterized protein LOC107816475 [Nicotiana tabacum]
MAGNYVCNDVDSSNYIIDTGVTNHVTGNKDLLENLALVGNIGQVQFPTGDSIAITHRGNHQLSGGDVLSNVLCVPAFRFNLVSVSKLIKDLNCYVTFFPTFCVFQELLYGRVKEIDRELDGLYYIQSLAKNKRVAVPHSFAVTKGIARDGSTALWHKQMGHVHVSVLKRIPVFQGFIIMEKTQFQKIIKKFISDNGVEFFNSTCKEVFTSHGILYQSHLFLDSHVIPRQELLDDTSEGPVAPVLPSVHCHTDKSLPQTNVAPDDPASYDGLSFKYQSYLSKISIEEEPTSYGAAAKDTKWANPMKAEIKALEDNKTWDIVPLPKGKKKVAAKIVVVLVYVDDILITGDDSQLIQATKLVLQNNFRIKDLGSKHVASPMEVNQKLTTTKFGTHMGVTDDPSLSYPGPYQRLFGCLLYLSATRPDISFDVQCLSQFMHSPKESHMEASNSKSVTVYLVKLIDSPISWRSKKQSTISRSSAEAEYCSLSSTVAEVVWLQGLFKELGVSSPSPVPINCDSKSAIQISANPVFHERAKHVDIDCHFICEKVQQGIVNTLYLAATEQQADVLTKGLGRLLHEYFVSKLGMKNIFIPPRLRGCKG